MESWSELWTNRRSRSKRIPDNLNQQMIALLLLLYYFIVDEYYCVYYDVLLEPEDYSTAERVILSFSAQSEKVNIKINRKRYITM